MTYAALEQSRESGKPAELYKFRMQASSIDDSFPPPPPAPGELVMDNVMLTASWTEQLPLFGWDPIIAASYPPVSPESYFLNVGGYIEVWAAYNGGLGGGNASMYYEGTVTGLEPSHVYVLRVLGVHTNYSLGGLGTRIPAPYGDGNSFGDDSEDFNDPLNPTGDTDGPGWGPDPGYMDRTFTTDLTGEFKVHFGHFGIQVATAEIAFLHGLWIYDPAIPANPEESIDGVSFPGVEMNFTSADEIIVYNGDTYIPGLIVRDALQHSSDGIHKNQLSVDIERTMALAPFVNTQLPPIGPIECEVYRLNRDDLTEAATVFVGHVLRTELQKTTITLIMGATERYVTKKSPRALMQPRCGNFLGDEYCGINLVTFSTSGEITDVEESGRLLTITGLDTFVDGDLTYFVPGFIVSPSGRRYYITSQLTGDKVRLWKPSPELSAGTVVRVVAGCDGLTSTCKERFDNLENRRGFDLMVVRNPFTGGGLA